MKNLTSIDLSKNPKLLSDPDVSKSYETTEIPWVSVKLSQNELRELPIVFITLMKDSLESLDLSKNYFFQLGHFPHMDKLKSLILDDCNIFSIQDKAFGNLTNLKQLSLQQLLPALACSF